MTGILALVELAIMLMLNSRTIALSLLSSLVLFGALSAEANAQSTTGVDNTSTETTQEDVGSTATDSWEDTTGFTDSGSWPGSSTASWVPSGPPIYGFVSCPTYRSSEFPFPGSSGGIHSGAFEGNDLLDLGYRCSIDSNFGLVRYSCACGEMEDQEKQGQLEFDWFVQRPSYEAQLAGCQEIFRQQCGDVEVVAKSTCESPYGGCQAAVVKTDLDGSVSSSVSQTCECLDQTGWGVRAHFSGTPTLNGAVLRDHCEAELSLCGVEPVGDGLGSELGLGTIKSSTVGCASAFGMCLLNEGEDGQQQVTCECENGRRTEAKGILGWPSLDSSGRLLSCTDELAICMPNGKATPELGGEAQAPGSTGGFMPGNSTGTGGGAIPGDAQAPVQVNCSMGEGSGRGGLALMSLGLLGLLRRRRS